MEKKQTHNQNEANRNNLKLTEIRFLIQKKPRSSKKNYY